MKNQNINQSKLSIVNCQLIIITVILFFIPVIGFSQNIGISSTGNTPNASALLDVDASPGNNKGMLIPRVTQAERIAMNPLPAAAQGLTVYQTDGTQGFYYNISTTTTPNWAFLVPNSCTGYDNLVIQSTSTSTVTITADRLCVDSLSLSSINVTIDIGVVGIAGGLDAGAKAANTWYYVFVISNSSGTSVNGLLSLSSTAPTMPSGYTKKRRVGAVWNNASSNFRQFVQEGNFCLYQEDDNFLLQAGSATTWTTINASAYIPPTSRRGYFNVVTHGIYSSPNLYAGVNIRRAGGSGTYGQLRNHIYSTSSSSDLVADKTFGFCDTNASQQIEYYIGNAPLLLSGGAYIGVAGYYDRF
ncbi:MAG: hypothetical protein AABZ32_04830 [Bacteroidota bacterium]